MWAQMFRTHCYQMTFAHLLLRKSKNKKKPSLYCTVGVQAELPKPVFLFKVYDPWDGASQHAITRHVALKSRYAVPQVCNLMGGIGPNVGCTTDRLLRNGYMDWRVQDEWKWHLQINLGYKYGAIKLMVFCLYRNTSKVWNNYDF